MDENQPKPKSLKSNYIYNLIYQLLLIVVPIFVTPYLSRVLFSEGLGQYSFTYSIVNYFVLFANLGFNLYAQRYIAQNKDDKKKQSIAFWEILIVRFVTTIISLLVYLPIVFLKVFDEKYYILLLIQSINIIAVAFDFTFLLQGNEEFKKIAIRNIIIKMAGIACIFIFIKSFDDLWLYTLIQCLVIFISNISLIVYVPRFLEKVSIRELKPAKHIKPTLILFIPTIAQAVYTTIDRALIGLITNNDSLVGNYDTTEKLVKMCFSALAALVTVYIPRNAALYQAGKIDELKNNVLFLIKFTFLVGIPMVLGIICISDRIMPIYLGENYGLDNIENSILLLKLLSPLIVIIGLGNAVGSGLLFSIGKDGKFTISIIIGAIVNITLNFILIKYYGNIGATIATLIAESIVTISIFIFSKKYISLLEILKTSWKYFIAGTLMFVICFLENRYFNYNIFNIILIVASGVVSYFAVLLILREKVLWSFINQIYKKIFHK